MHSYIVPFIQLRMNAHLNNLEGGCVIMALLRKKRAEVMEQGRLKRGNWEIDPSAAHYKNYVWWLRNGGNRPVTENFCHYWRVVALWVPLQKLKLRLKTDGARRTIKVLISLLVIAFVAVIATLFTNEALGVLIGAVIVLYLVYSFKVTCFVYETVFDDESSSWSWQWLKGKHLSVVILCAALSLPMLIVVGVLLGILFVLYELFHEREVHRWLIDTNVRGIWWLTPLTITVVTALVYLLTTAWLLPVPEGLAQLSRDLLAIVGVLLGIVSVVFALAFMLVGVEERRKKNAHKAEAARARAVRCENDDLLHSLFAILHPGESGDEERFEEWTRDFVSETHFWDLSDLYRSTPYVIIESLPEEWFVKLLEYYGLDDLDGLYDKYYPSTTARTASRPQRPRKRPISGATKTIADFLRLLWAYMVTKKWKICPIVTLPE